LYNIGVSNVSPQKAAIIALWEMILGPLWVAIFLNEYPPINALLGLVVILLGIILNAFISDNERSIKLKEELRADNYA
jgi:DME family drug/metabolite transporter